jgi:hypothetical protein
MKRGTHGKSTHVRGNLRSVVARDTREAHSMFARTS